MKSLKNEFGLKMFASSGGTGLRRDFFEKSTKTDTAGRRKLSLIEYKEENIVLRANDACFVV